MQSQHCGSTGLGADGFVPLATGEVQIVAMRKANNIALCGMLDQREPLALGVRLIALRIITCVLPTKFIG